VKRYTAPGKAVTQSICCTEPDPAADDFSIGFVHGPVTSYGMLMSEVSRSCLRHKDHGITSDHANSDVINMCNLPTYKNGIYPDLGDLKFARERQSFWTL